ncbi:MAG: DUF6683 family protein [Pleurocapsa sp.]
MLDRRQIVRIRAKELRILDFLSYCSLFRLRTLTWATLIAIPSTLAFDFISSASSFSLTGQQIAIPQDLKNIRRDSDFPFASESSTVTNTIASNLTETELQQARKQFDFKSSPSISEQVIIDVATRLSEKDSQLDPQWLVAELKQADAVKKTQAFLSNQYGLNVNNLVDVLTFYYIASWQVVHHKIEDSPNEVVQAVRSQLTGTLSAIASDIPQDDSSRQELAETMIYDATLNASVYQSAQSSRNQATLNSISEQVHQTMLSQGIDMRKLELSSKGLSEVNSGQSATLSTPFSTPSTPETATVPPTKPNSSQTRSTATDSKIHGVYLQWVSTGTTMYTLHRILFTNGDILADLSLAPEDVDIAASKATSPKKWGRWRIEGGEYVIQWHDGENRWATDSGTFMPGVRAPNDLRLEGKFRSMSSISVPTPGFAAQVTSTWSDIELKGDGRFSKQGGMTTSGPNIGGGTVRPQSQSGRYRIDGYTIEFTFDDGRVERTGFFILGSRDMNPSVDEVKSFAIGNNTFTPVRDRDRRR